MTVISQVLVQPSWIVQMEICVEIVNLLCMYDDPKTKLYFTSPIPLLDYTVIDLSRTLLAFLLEKLTQAL